MGRWVGTRAADDGIELGLGQVPSARYPLAGVVGKAFPVVLSPGSAAVYKPMLSSMWTPD